MYNLSGFIVPVLQLETRWRCMSDNNKYIIIIVTVNVFHKLRKGS